ncbi:carbohydrate ABC transporter permease [Paenibacillus sp. J5C_2022]|uniref:carbohydrate ABC transporter permease n=1 Tax=Paenibacillus sp. J5C2022 TaxID=2977129 RepID=UPI0021D25636|nr:carbohydrate ABC transporter permease [Paenibacillus sp. J5C2022]MCU6712492.1 carbohydrate ABC transporter permease [Paenibacillus sp. J5C2022]
MAFVLKKNKSDYVVDSVLYLVLALFCLVTLFPLYFVFIMSITPYEEVLKHGGFVLIPSTVTFEAFHTILESGVVPKALGVTTYITLLGTFLNILVTTGLAYALSKKYLPGRNIVLMGIVFTMLFSGGLIPLFLTVKATGLMNTLWALMIPGLVSSFNMLIMKTYFEGLPHEVEEAAKVDGCGDLQTLIRIVLPLSLPVIATMALFYGVGHWNTYFAGIMYINDRDLFPLQVVLRNMIVAPSVSQELSVSANEVEMLPPETIKMAVVVVAIIPVLVIYPFLQKYFMKGMLLGAVKG